MKEKIDYFNYSLATIIPDYCHSVPVWDRLLSLGFSGILKESERMRSENTASRALTDDEKAFYDGINITYTAITRFIGRLAALAAKNPATQARFILIKSLRVFQHFMNSAIRTG